MMWFIKGIAFGVGAGLGFYLLLLSLPYWV